MEVEVKERNELIAITFSHSVAMEGPYSIYVVRMPNRGNSKYYYKILNGISERDARRQDFIDDIANYGSKISYLRNSMTFINRKIKECENREKSRLEDEEYFRLLTEEESCAMSSNSYALAKAKYHQEATLF